MFSFSKRTRATALQPFIQFDTGTASFSETDLLKTELSRAFSEAERQKRCFTGNKITDLPFLASVTSLLDHNIGKKHSVLLYILEYCGLPSLKYKHDSHDGEQSA